MTLWPGTSADKLHAAHVQIGTSVVHSQYIHFSLFQGRNRCRLSGGARAKNFPVSGG